MQKLALLILFGALLAPTPASSGEAVGEASDSTYTGSPTVVDGDTLILDGEKIMLVNVSAPELGDMCNAIRFKGGHLSDGLEGDDVKPPEEVLGVTTVPLDIKRGEYTTKREESGEEPLFVTTWGFGVFGPEPAYPVLDAGDLSRRFLEHLIDGRTVSCRAVWSSYGMEWAICKAGSDEKSLNYQMLYWQYANREYGDPGYRTLPKADRPPEYRWHKNVEKRKTYNRIAPGLRGVGSCLATWKIDFENE